MSQNERDDYDDDRLAPKPVLNPKLLNWAGYLWLIAWVWFLIGGLIFFGFEINRNDNPTIKLILLIHLLIASLFLAGSGYINTGKDSILVPVTVGSVLVALCSGWFGLQIGWFMFSESITATFSVKVAGLLLLIFTGVFISIILAASILTLFIYDRAKRIANSNTKME